MSIEIKNIHANRSVIFHTPGGFQGDKCPFGTGGEKSIEVRYGFVAVKFGSASYRAKLTHFSLVNIRISLRNINERCILCLVVFYET